MIANFSANYLITSGLPIYIFLNPQVDFYFLLF